MKTLKNTFVILFISLLTFSCSNNDDDATTPLPSTSSDFIRCKLDGVAFEATGATILADQNEIAFNMNSDVRSGGIGMDFSFFGQAAVGTYTVNPSNLTSVGRLQYRSPDIYSTGVCTGSNGTLIITAKNGNIIEGTFNFSGKKIALCGEPAKVITEGTFRITLL